MRKAYSVCAEFKADVSKKQPMPGQSPEMPLKKGKGNFSSSGMNLTKSFTNLIHLSI